MNSDILKEKIKIAKESVIEEEEPYKTEAFKVILSKLIDDASDTKSLNLAEDTELKKPSIIPNPISEESRIFEKFGINKNELNDVMTIENDTIEIIAPLTGNETRKQIVATQCILASYDTLLGKEWVNSHQLRTCLDLSGIGELDHLARNLKRNANLVRIKGKKPNLEYKLFGPARKEAYEIIRKLAKGEKLE